MKGEFLSRRRGFIFGIFWVFSGSVIAVQFGIYTVDAIRAGDWFSVVISAYGALIGLLVGCAALLCMGRSKTSSLQISDGVLSAEYGQSKSIKLNLSDISGIALNGLVLTLTYGEGKRAVLPPLLNARAVYAYLRDHEVPAGLYGGEDDAGLERLLHRCKRRMIVNGVLCIGTMLASVVSVIIAMVLTGLRDVAEFTGSDMTVFLIMLAAVTVLTVLTFVFADALGKSRVRGTELFTEMSSRAGHLNASQPSAERYGEIIGARCFDEYRSRYIVFRVNDGDGDSDGGDESKEAQPRYSFAVEVFYLKNMCWHTFGNYSFGEVYGTPDDAADAAEEIIGDVYFED